ncbi:MAG: alanine--tRNA ligase [Gemmatimonadetes bacterium]|nr:alanine--tRNA ligase [Gemmatimonadota bacterium]
MTTAEIRTSFLEFFRARGHSVEASSSLVPKNDPTLLFTNAGMVQFKGVFLGIEELPFKRAATSQKCVRAGGKHNDLEEVGRTARHHTFFEMLGNFSFGDYFKRDAIAYAWEFLTDELGLDPDRLLVSIHDSDDDAFDLWQEVVKLPPERIFRLGDKDNFWQMADTGPCGPCSELHYDLRSAEERKGTLTLEEFVDLGERGILIELWNLVFMQFNRDEEGTLHPLPAPSIDTGAGLERLAAVVQGADSNYDTDAFSPLLDAVSQTLGRPYDAETEEGVGYRVLADHARAVAFLLADGVFPSNAGRGYVLRRILRRAVRHAWLLGRREPTLVEVVAAVIETMSEAYPELEESREHLLSTTRAEEDRFLSTIEGGMARFDELAPASGAQGKRKAVISGADAFKLYDTFGFPLDLTELMAEERGYRVDVIGFENALEEQRERSRADRAQSDLKLSREDLVEGWQTLQAKGEQRFTGYDQLESATVVLAVRVSEDGLALQLADNPFYVEGGGQVSDTGLVEGDGWSSEIRDVARVGDRVALLGTAPEGAFPARPEAPLKVRALVDPSSRRDTQRNHTATHLLHAALRRVLGTHVAQRGSLVTSDRLRFDFSHTSPMTEDERRAVEEMVREGIWEDHALTIGQHPYDEAVRDGAMALFGEKYDDVVRVVEIPGVSMELCGGTHVTHTGEIGLFKITSETGVAAGVRRVEGLTGRRALQDLERRAGRLDEVAAVLETSPENAAARAEHLLAEIKDLEGLLDDLRSGGGAGESVVLQDAISIDDITTEYKAIRLRARNADDARKWGDTFLAEERSGVAVVSADMPEGKHTLFAFVTDDLIGRGVRADAVVREIAAVVGGRGGGRPHMAQAGVEDPDRIDEALRLGREVVERLTREAGS